MVQISGSFKHVCSSPFVFCCCACLFIATYSLFDFNLKIKVIVRGQKATDSMSGKASLVEGHDVGDLHFPPGLRLFACSCKLVQTNTKMLSDKVFFFFSLCGPWWGQRRGRGGGGESSWTKDPSERELSFDSILESCVYLIARYFR